VDDFLPEGVKGAIRDAYRTGVADVEDKFESHKADEDALTGALGQMVSRGPWVIFADGKTYTCRISYTKLRGRGHGAPEKKLGADGFFQIDVRDQQGEPVLQKGLPFQAKNQWSRADKKFIEQAGNMVRSAGQGLVIDYAPNGFSACTAHDLIEARGRKRTLKQQGRLRPLGQVLGNDFLDCKVGVHGLVYDARLQAFRGDMRLPVEHLFTTDVRMIADSDRGTRRDS